MLKYKNDIAIIGLGRFGSAVTNQLIKMGRSVVLIDADEDNLRPWGDIVTSIYVADATDLNTLKRIGIQNLSTIIVAAPDNIEIIATLLELNVKNIMARSTSTKHARVLRQIGVSHIVLPEVEAGTRTALIAANDNFIKFSQNMNEVGDGFVMSTTSLYNAKLEGKSIRDLNLTKQGASIVLIKSKGKAQIPMGNTVLQRGDQITMIGQVEVINEIFAVFNRQRKADDDTISKSRNQMTDQASK